MNDMETETSAIPLTAGLGMSAVGTFLLAFTSAPILILVGGIACLAGLIATLVGVYRLASNVDRAATRVPRADPTQDRPASTT